MFFISNIKLSFLFVRSFILVILFAIAKTSFAEWTAEFDNAVYYTDDVGLFSVTRRLSLDEDPTQPVVDEPDQGSDFVYEPNAVLTWRGENDWGEMAVIADAGGYIFFDKTAFTHGFYQLQLEQAFSTASRVRLFYDLIPDLLIGLNQPNKESEHEAEAEERLTSHIWTAHLEQRIDDSITMVLLARYGLRNYEAPFKHRDTQFWTIGTHLEWEITSDIALALGYHYEPGSADHDSNTDFNDDISYINHYFSTELSITILPDLILNLIFDYERNNFTSQNRSDYHYGTFENIYQGEIELIYELDHSLEMILGWQHGQRKFSFEEEAVKNNNVWLGLGYTF